VSQSLHRLCGTLPQVWRRLGASTPVFFYGLDETDETAEDIDKGKTLIVRKPGQKVVKGNPLVSIKTMTIVAMTSSRICTAKECWCAMRMIVRHDGAKECLCIE